MVCNEGPSPILNWVPLSIIRAGQGVGRGCSSLSKFFRVTAILLLVGFLCRVNTAAADLIGLP
jgi:hypothetical protein